MAGFTLSPTIPREVPQTIQMDLLRFREINWDVLNRTINVFLDIGHTAGGPEWFPLSESYPIVSVSEATPTTRNDITTTIPSGDHVTNFETKTTPDDSLLSDLDEAVFELMDEMDYFAGTVT